VSAMLAFPTHAVELSAVHGRRRQRHDGDHPFT
jgi:hypothetical protein